MFNILRTSLLASVLVAAFTGAAPAIAGDIGSYIVVLHSGADASVIATQHGRAHGFTPEHVYSHALRGYSARMSATAAARLAASPAVQFVQPDGVVTATAQTLPTGVDRAEAEKSPTAKINGVDERVDVDVAIIDTGIDLDHPDLNVYTAGAKNCSTGRSADDGNGHGTHVGGTVGALDNSTGVVGVAPGARLWPVRVLNNQGSGSFSSIICGVELRHRQRPQDRGCQHEPRRLWV